MKLLKSKLSLAVLTALNISIALPSIASDDLIERLQAMHAQTTQPAYQMHKATHTHLNTCIKHLVEDDKHGQLLAVQDVFKSLRHTLANPDFDKANQAIVELTRPVVELCRASLQSDEQNFEALSRNDFRQIARSHQQELINFFNTSTQAQVDDPNIFGQHFFIPMLIRDVALLTQNMLTLSDSKALQLVSLVAYFQLRTYKDKLASGQMMPHFTFTSQEHATFQTDFDGLDQSFKDIITMNENARTYKLNHANNSPITAFVGALGMDLPAMIQGLKDNLIPDMTVQALKQQMPRGI